VVLDAARSRWCTPMKLAAFASFIHKWLALLVGVQVLFWVASGLFFAVYPIERVRSEHRIAERQIAPLSAPLPDVSPVLPEPATRVTYERTAAGEAVAVAEFAERRPILVDLATMRVASPLSAEAASEIALAYTTGAPRVRERTLITEESPEYRGALPHQPAGHQARRLPPGRKRAEC